MLFRGLLLAACVGALAIGGAVALVSVALEEDGETQPAVARMRFVMQDARGAHGLVATKGPAFERLAELVPLPLPDALPRPDRAEGCYPAVLTIELSDGVRREYGPCRRPEELLPLSLALCRKLELASARCDRLRTEGVGGGEPA